MYKHNSSIRSSFVGFTNGERTKHSDKDSTSGDSVEPTFVGVTEGKRTNDGVINSTFDAGFENLVFFGGVGTNIQSVGSTLVLNFQSVSHIIIVQF
jgi:hypothetical protein